ncbi:MAG: Holliday junction branch migration protein RuvA [Patescibacteria group bacterium]
MIAQLTGTIVSAQKNPLVLDVHGVGYAVWVPQRLFGTVTPGSTVTILTHTHVREDVLMLFGFLREEERVLFELLLGVSGIGPKTALSVLDHESGEIKRAIVDSDVEFFTGIPRLGKKNAQKIIIEIKSKLGNSPDIDLAARDTQDSKAVMDALVSMGFDKNEAKEALKKVPAEGSLEEKIKYALKRLG